MKKTILIIVIGILALLIIGSVAGWYFFLRNRVTNTPNVTVPLEESSEKTLAPKVASLSKDLQIPWAIDTLPNGDFIFTERDGYVRVISRASGKKSDILLEVKDINIGEGGLLGLTLHPQYPAKPWVYVYYTYAASEGVTKNKVVRYDFDGARFSNEKVLLAEIPGAKFHDGGRIAFGPEGFLYIGTGDALTSESAQDTTVLSGKILRMTEDGQAAPGNPFNTYVYSYGHRNVQGLAWDAKGTMYATEHGNSAHDEVNKIEAGKNYGWPVIEGQQTREGMVTPILESGRDTWAPSGVAFYNGSLYFGGLAGQALYEVELKEGNAPTLITHLKGEFGRIRDVFVGPDAFLYVLTNNRDGRGVPVNADDQVLRVNPEKL